MCLALKQREKQSESDSKAYGASALGSSRGTLMSYNDWSAYSLREEPFPFRTVSDEGKENRNRHDVTQTCCRI